MSSEQLSDKPLPPETRVCKQCGEVLFASAKSCWLCLENESVEEGEPRRQIQRSETSGEDRLSWILFGILAVGLAVGAALESPGILLIGFILMVPVFIRMIVKSMARKNQEPRGRPNPTQEPAAAAHEPDGCVSLVGALAVAVLVTFAAIAAACGNCFPLIWGGKL